MRHFRVINLFVEVDVRIHAESPDGIKHGIETDFGSKAACHYDSACIDHRVVGELSVFSSFISELNGSPVAPCLLF